jgi:hypothetical protein
MHNYVGDGYENYTDTMPVVYALARLKNNCRSAVPSFPSIHKRIQTVGPISFKLGMNDMRWILKDF